VIKTKVSHLLLFLFFFFSLAISAQTKEEKIPLDLALVKIEQLYKLNFSYADENLKNKFIKLPLTILSIDALLAYLNSKTGLSFERISSKTIIVRDLYVNNFETQFLEEILVTEFLTKGIALKDDGVTVINPSKFGILPD